MILKNGEQEFELVFSTRNYMSTKNLLRCVNLRKSLLKACRDDDFETLAKTIQVFSGDKIPNIDSAYDAIDVYCAEHDISKREMFLNVIEEIGEHGFFGEKKTAQELQKMLTSPEMDIDMDAMMTKVMDSMEGEMLAKMIQNAGMTIGATTSTISVPPLTAAE